ncbi:hypothetical protein [Novosphingobium terrae]|uniref:hypothetical protein n=1 Tax=Novosphingobium terrae TaxID=2726189 RepID=UPI00197F8055|nr:hypothetical protein [Novosphingobium terrae]
MALSEKGGVERMQRAACREINETFRICPKGYLRSCEMRRFGQLGLAKSARAGKSASYD